MLILHLITDVIYVTCTLFEFLFYFKLPGGMKVQEDKMLIFINCVL